MEVKFDPQISSTLLLGGSRSSVEKLILPLVESGISTRPAVVTSLSMGVPYGHREVTRFC